MSLALEQVPVLAPHLEDIVFSEEMIQARVRELAREISRDYGSRDLLMVGILKGAYVLTSDLARALEIEADFDFVGISRYRRTKGVKEVRITHDLSRCIEGRDLLLIEDIVDTGLTLHFLIEMLKERRPSSIFICSLLDRPDLRLAEIPLRYVGFNVSEEFLVGYGLDYRERFRNLPFIARMQMAKDAFLEA